MGSNSARHAIALLLTAHQCSHAHLGCFAGSSSKQAGCAAAALFAFNEDALLMSNMALRLRLMGARTKQGPQDTEVGTNSFLHGSAAQWPQSGARARWTQDASRRLGLDGKLLCLLRSAADAPTAQCFSSARAGRSALSLPLLNACLSNGQHILQAPRSGHIFTGVRQLSSCQAERPPRSAPRSPGWLA
jgi:hypothetical protein